MSSSEDDSDNNSEEYIKKKTINVNSARNIVQKLFNREVNGSIMRNASQKESKIFEKIPSRLTFCLMDIVPSSYLRSHVFMGFSQCGQYLLSFTYSNFISSYQRETCKFTLHFLLWVPGQKVRSVHKVPLFDDDCVENKVSVSIAQWKNKPEVLVAYGIGESCSKFSYLSVIGVPHLGCKNCATSAMDEGVSLWTERCIKHNYAIHTKFFCTSDSNSTYEPVVQLAYSNQIIIYTDFIHVLEVDFVNSNEPSDNDDLKSTLDRDEAFTNVENTFTNPSTPASDISAMYQSPKYHNNVVQNIIEDFSDFEVEPFQLSKPVQLPDVMGQELCIQASSISNNLIEEWEVSSASIKTLISPPLRSPRRRPAESMSRFNETHRIIAEETYEFVEETDTKCEKIGMFRKRRLADKKYEFSEDNNENIVPFRVLRSNRKYFIGNTSKSVPKRPKSPPVESVVLRARNHINTPQPTPTTSSDHKINTLCANHNMDYNSDCEYRVTEMLDDGSRKTVAIHDNTSKTLSDNVIDPLDPYLVHSGNSDCSKVFTRYFVESDDEITSIITNSEDDCMSGYHVALHLSAHGAGYVPLQAIGPGAWERIRSSSDNLPLTLRTQQRSLDTELLCNEVCVRLCKLYGMKFIYCFDWGCHVIDVCQSSGCLSGLCAMWLWASDGSDSNKCDTCKEVNTTCLLHRRQYAAECLFTSDLVTGVYRTEKVSLTEDTSNDQTRVSGTERARLLAKKLSPKSMPPGNECRLLTTLIGRSLRKLTDADHCIEITKNYLDSSDSEPSSPVSSEISSGEYISDPII